MIVEIIPATKLITNTTIKFLFECDVFFSIPVNLSENFSKTSVETSTVSAFLMCSSVFSSSVLIEASYPIFATLFNGGLGVCVSFGDSWVRANFKFSITRVFSKQLSQIIPRSTSKMKNNAF